MFIQIDKSSSTPVSRQVMDQIRAQCLSRSLRPGDKLDSVRQLAVQLAINPNTVLRVYEKLTAEGLLVRRHGAGTFVAEPVPGGQLDSERAQFEEEFAHLVRRGTMLGYRPAELSDLVDTAAKPAPSPHSTV
ncbi:MAG: GntR family transcriptional regulator [Planctomycetota bacterium]